MYVTTYTIHSTVNGSRTMIPHMIYYDVYLYVVEVLFRFYLF